MDANRGGIVLQYSKKTDIGRVREHNEDAVAIINIAPGMDVAMVADGMGGHRGGSIASQMTIDIISEVIKDNASPLVLRRAIEEANRQVYEHGQNEEACLGMGTTLVMAVIQKETVLVANVGDSRAYHLDSQTRQCRRMTTDHSLVEQLIQSGELTREEERTFPFRNVITRAVGIEPDVMIDFFELEWRQGDLLLLCSDGLTEYLSDATLCKKLLQDKPIQTICDELVNMAKHAGGRDNITVLLVKNAEGGGSE